MRGGPLPGGGLRGRAPAPRDDAGAQRDRAWGARGAGAALRRRGASRKHDATRTLAGSRTFRLASQDPVLISAPLALSEKPPAPCPPFSAAPQDLDPATLMPRAGWRQVFELRSEFPAGGGARSRRLRLRGGVGG